MLVRPFYRQDALTSGITLKIFLKRTKHSENISEKNRKKNIS
jgi:hypothetical protein